MPLPNGIKAAPVRHCRPGPEHRLQEVRRRRDRNHRLRLRPVPTL